MEELTSNVVEQTQEIQRQDDFDLLNDNVLISVHGSMMLIAWIGAGSIGIIIAR